MKLVLVPFLLLGGAPPDPSICSPPLDRPSVAECARRNSPALRADVERIATARGQTLEARTILPANPTVDFSLAGRVDDTGRTALNMYGTLTQPIEIGGQRRRRMAVVEAQREVYEQQAALTERQVVAAALLAYYDALAAERELEIVQRATQTAALVLRLATERKAAGIGTGLDQQLASGLHARQLEQLALARGRLNEAKARLSSLTGLDPTVHGSSPTGELEPLPLPDDALADLGRRSVRQRPEIAAARAMQRTESRRLELLGRDRIPDPSLSVFVQRDGFDERVIGGGISIPIPLPAPLGRVARGRIDATRVRVREAQARVSAHERQAQLETATAFHHYRARREAAQAYPPNASTARRDALDELVAEIEAGRLPVREALVTQDALLDALLREVEARHQLCRATVELALAAGLALEDDR